MINYVNGAGMIISPPLKSGEEADRWIEFYNHEEAMGRTIDPEKIKRQVEDERVKAAELFHSQIVRKRIDMKLDSDVLECVVSVMIEFKNRAELVQLEKRRKLLIQSILLAVLCLILMLINFIQTIS